MTDAGLDTGVQFDTPLVIGGQAFRSRLMVGTGKYRSNPEMVAAIEASGADVVTVAVRRVDLDRTKEEGVLFHLAPSRYFLLANTAGCYSADEAIRYARLGRAAGFNDFVKLEVIGDKETLLPDASGLLEATRVLVKEGFKVLAYTNDDLITALRLEEAGAAAVMPLASPIGSGLGLLNPYSIRTIKRRLGVPVIVDAGVGTASDACLTMEQGVDGILMNTALAEARDAVLMAHAMRGAVDSVARPTSRDGCRGARWLCRRRPSRGCSRNEARRPAGGRRQRHRRPPSGAARGDEVLLAVRQGEPFETALARALASLRGGQAPRA
jgi:thiazole synthase